MPIFPEVLHTEQPVIGGLGIGQKVSGRAAVQKSRVHQETAKRTLPDLQFLRRSPDIGAVFFMDKGVIEICFRPQPFHLAGELPVFLMLGKKLIGKSQKYFRLFRRLLQKGGSHVPARLADHGENFVKHPFFKAFRTRHPTMNNQAVHITLRDKCHRLVSACGGDGTFRSPPRMIPDCLAGIAIPQGLCHIRTAKQILAVLLDHSDAAKFAVIENRHLVIHSGPPFRRPQFRVQPRWAWW